MDITYLLKEEGRKGNEKLIWSDSKKSARINPPIPYQEETIHFDGNPTTLQEAIRIANIYKPYFPVPKRAEVTFLEPELHLTEDPFFTVQYVVAKR